jgi:hypothetical protein
MSAKIRAMNERHGYGQKDRIYRIWIAMRRRCEDPKREGYPSYGGRGIKVCKEWRVSFSAFKAWADSAGYSDSLSIDRIDSHGNYKPSNCRWATVAEQGANKREGCYVEINGVIKTVFQWAKDEGMHLTTLYRRYYKGVRGADLIAKGYVPTPAVAEKVKKQPRFRAVPALASSRIAGQPKD